MTELCRPWNCPVCRSGSRCSGIRRRTPRTSGCSRDSWMPHGSTAMPSTTLINPADETVLRTVEHTTLAGVDDAVAHAVSAQRAWAALPPAARASALRDFATVVGDHIEELALLEVANSGHPI